MVEMPCVEVLTAFAKAPSGKRATGYSYLELLDAMRADPDEAVVRFKAVLKDARPSVRAWACIAGAKACGRKFVPTLLEAFGDRSKDVQEMVISGLQEIEPSGGLLRPLVIQMRQRLLTWDGEGAPRIARLLAVLNDIDAVPYLERYLQRADIDVVDRARGADFLLYLREGLEGILGRIRSHTDHADMAGLCKIAFFVGSPDVESALQHLLATAPDERCRMLVRQTLDAMKAARAEGPPPYWIWSGTKGLVAVCILLLGFALQTERRPFGPVDLAFGHGGAGGSIHGAWPTERIGFSYAMNEMRDEPMDARAAALLQALYSALQGHSSPARSPLKA